MKRKFIVLMAVFMLVVTVSVPIAFAGEENNSKSTDYFKSMFDSMRNWIKDAQEKGQITEEEAEGWEEHFDYMEKFHDKNGFSGHCGSYGGGGTVPNGQSQSYNPGPRGGMMGGYYNGGMMGSYDNREF